MKSVSTLKELRESLGVTQVELARRLYGFDAAQSRQSYISAFENREDHKISSLKEYVGALGGKLKLICKFKGKRHELLLED